MNEQLAGVRWRVSTCSSDNGGNCVEVGPLVDGSGRIAVRDSKDRAGAAMIYPAASWRVFLTALRTDAGSR